MRHDHESFGELHHAILEAVASAGEPIGQGRIKLVLGRDGDSPSVATIGRRLQELEFEGLIESVGVQGRTITSQGREILSRLQAHATLRESGEALLTTLSRGDKEHLLDLLSTRRIIEGATAALAAARATPQRVAELEALLKLQEESVEHGELGVDEDVTFHEAIARASGNSVLASLVSLLRQHHRYNLAISSIRAAVGSRLVVDHTNILEAIKANDPVAAEAAMEHHLTTLAADLKRLWPEADADPDPSGESPG